MDKYVTADVIRRLRERGHMTQAQLAEKLFVSAKAVSRWETGRGYPDISLLEPLAKALDISVAELLSGNAVHNQNRSANMTRCKWYVCPVCGNVIESTGEALVSCCGISLPPLEAEPADDAHAIGMQIVEDEYYVTLSHPMTKDHYISFLAAVSDMGVQFVKLYPEGSAEAPTEPAGETVGAERRSEGLSHRISSKRQQSLSHAVACQLPLHKGAF
ncbi:MAG: helix-turn-helix domain-containing protein, partial [Clostridia bacterium]|nr:helix-turn-helix domain-containing protein [Clostridia bacterium]